MKSNIDLKLRGVRGGSPNWQPNKGEITSFIDNEGLISIDAFQGFGSTYTRREKCLITVFKAGKHFWEGTFEQLLYLLKQRDK